MIAPKSSPARRKVTLAEELQPVLTRGNVQRCIAEVIRGCGARTQGGERKTLQGADAFKRFCSARIGHPVEKFVDSPS